MYHVALRSRADVRISVRSKPLYGNRLRRAYRMTTLLIVVVVLACLAARWRASRRPRISGSGRGKASFVVVVARKVGSPSFFKPGRVERGRASGTRAFSVFRAFFFFDFRGFRAKDKTCVRKYTRKKRKTPPVRRSCDTATPMTWEKMLRSIVDRNVTWEGRAVKWGGVISRRFVRSWRAEVCVLYTRELKFLSVLLNPRE